VILHKEKLKVSQLTLSTYSSFESIALKRGNNAVLTFKLLTYLCSISPNVIILGDFNIHIDSQ